MLAKLTHTQQYHHHYQDTLAGLEHSKKELHLPQPSMGPQRGQPRSNFDPTTWNSLESTDLSTE